MKGIADCLSDNLCPFKEFLLVGSIAGDKAFVNAAGTHKAPFVMVAAKPYLGDVFELAVFCNLSGIDVAVVIKYRCFFCIPVEKSPRSGGG